MRKHLQPIFILLVTFCASITITSFGQPDTPKIPKPLIKGNFLLCPNSTGTFRTQKGYDTYQWFKRNYGSDRTKPIEGATSRELTVSSNDAPAYFSVVVTVKNIKRRSEEKLVDGLVFLLPSVRSSGDFENGPGYFILNEGDTGIFALTKPYNTNITWYRNSEPIAGETLPKLYVTRGGVYTVQGAPRTCPDYIVPLGVDLIVKLKKNDAVSADAANSKAAIANISLYPNPAKDHVMLNASAFAGKNISVRLFTTDGKNLMTKKYNAVTNAIRIDLGNINPGMYYVEVSDNSKLQILKLIVTK